MKDTIKEQLKQRAGLSEEQAAKAADVVMEIIESKGGGLAKGLGGLGSMFGGKKE